MNAHKLQPDAKTRLERLASLPTLAQREELYIRRVMDLCEGNVALAAQVLGIGRATLYRRVKSLELPTGGERRRIELDRRLQALREEFARQPDAAPRLRQLVRLLGGPK